MPPIYVPLPNTTILSIILTSSTIRIETEVEAFPFESLVADCGGVLGLFIGFNFLMVWDWIMWIIDKFVINRMQSK